jgi:hypothetical protein
MANAQLIRFAQDEPHGHQQFFAPLPILALRKFIDYFRKLSG